MSVSGTQQRVYGTLTGGCIIDLHRFALVSGSTTLSPLEASTVTYADTTPYKQCGYKYSGYITLFLSISGSSVYAAVEVRICKNDAKRIVIETYGEVAKTVTGGMSLWFNKGSETSPDWVKLNSTTSGVIMPYATTSYTFTESKRNGSTTIDCCKKCPSCGCKTCNITGLSLSYKSPAGWPTGIGIRIIGDPFAALDKEITQISDNEKLETIKYSQGYKYPNARWYILTTNSHNFNTNITTNNIQFWSENDTLGAYLVISGDSIEYPYPGGEELFPGQTTVSYYGSSGIVSPSSTVSYGYTNNGDYTAFFASQKSFIEYKLKCDSLQFWIGDTGSHNSQNKLYYTDMDTAEVHLLGTLEPGQATGTITTSFPFDYLKNCMNCNICSRTSVDSTFLFPITSVCVDTLNVTNEHNYDLSKLVGRKIYLYKQEFNNFAHALTVTSASSNQITVDLDSVSYDEGHQVSGWIIDNTIDSIIIDAHITGIWPYYQSRLYYKWKIGTFAGALGLRPKWNITTTITDADGNNATGIQVGAFLAKSTYGGYDSAAHKLGVGWGGFTTISYTAHYDGGGIATECYVTVELLCISGRNPLTLDFRIELEELLDCRGENRVGDESFKLLYREPGIYSAPSWYGYVRINDLFYVSGWDQHPPTQDNYLTQTCNQILDPDTGGKGTLNYHYGYYYPYGGNPPGGAYTDVTYVRIDYTISCENKTIELVINQILPDISMFYTVRYTDDNNEIHTFIINPSDSSYTESFQYDYKKNCQ